MKLSIFRNRPSSNIGNFKQQTETFSMWKEKEELTPKQLFKLVCFNVVELRRP